MGTFVKRYGPFRREIEVAGEKYKLDLMVPEGDELLEPLGALLVRKPQPDGTATPVPGRLIVGWEGVNDTATGAPLEFNGENLEAFLAPLPIRGAVLQAIGYEGLAGEAMRGDLWRKNSKPPHVGGPAAAAQEPSAAPEPPAT